SRVLAVYITNYVNRHTFVEKLTNDITTIQCSRSLVLVFQGNSMIYKYAFGLLLIVGSYCFEIQDMIADKNNIVEDDSSFSERDNLMQIFVEKDTITAANAKCKEGTRCGYHQGTTYSWCETDHGWEYCCTEKCIRFEDRMLCRTGRIGFVFCGNPGSRTITGESCLPSHPCGSYGLTSISATFYNYYWCYTDEKKHWQRCCSPLDKCRDRDDGYGNWCYTALIIGRDSWRHCTP
ncbi:hypothetical protein CHS0354_030847, partial [Potamilus streckersoni]